MNKSILFLGVLGLLSGCNQQVKEEHAALLVRLDSMETVLEENQYTIGLLDQVGLYLDSIESHRHWITMNLETGLSQEDYVERMKVLNQYVQKAELTIGELENTRSTYATQLGRLRTKINGMEHEIQGLQLSVAHYQQENTALQDMLTISEDRLLDTQLDLEVTSDELEESQSEVKDLLEKVQLTEAESYYVRGEGMEEMARRIQFAPKKKKETLEEALALYTTASDLGFEPAKTKVEELSGKLKKE